LQNKFLTVTEVAERIRVNQQTVRNWIDRGELPAHRVGARRVRVTEKDLAEFVGVEHEPKPLSDSFSVPSMGPNSPSGPTPGALALDLKEIGELEELGDTMLVWSARLP
jgi:excisionase family DNA binding protein